MRVNKNLDVNLHLTNKLLIFILINSRYANIYVTKMSVHFSFDGTFTTYKYIEISYKK